MKVLGFISNFVEDKDNQNLIYNEYEEISIVVNFIILVWIFIDICVDSFAYNFKWLGFSIH